MKETIRNQKMDLKQFIKDHGLTAKLNKDESAYNIVRELKVDHPLEKRDVTWIKGYEIDNLELGGIYPYPISRINAEIKAYHMKDRGISPSSRERITLMLHRNNTTGSYVISLRQVINGSWFTIGAVSYNKFTTEFPPMIMNMSIRDSTRKYREEAVYNYLIACIMKIEEVNEVSTHPGCSRRLLKLYLSMHNEDKITLTHFYDTNFLIRTRKKVTLFVSSAWQNHMRHKKPSGKRSLPYRVGKSKIQGKGCFATRLIGEGQLIDTFKGFKQLTDHNTRHTLYVEDDAYQITNDIKYANHSYTPNCILHEMELFALREIKPDEELTFHYGEAWDKLLEDKKKLEKKNEQSKKG